MVMLLLLEVTPSDRTFTIFQSSPLQFYAALAILKSCFMMTRTCVKFLPAGLQSTHHIGLKQPFKCRCTKLMSPFSRKCWSFKNIFIMGYQYLRSELSIMEPTPSSLSVFPYICSLVPFQLFCQSHTLKNFVQGSSVSYGNVIYFSFINQATMTRAVKFYLVV